ncbi:MAG TPA: hypothetical protein VGE07_01515 [Herpetosiphonaceae bacterium]
MAVRPTMASLISRVRQMIGDDAGDGQVFDDQTIQDELDGNRQQVTELWLSHEASRQGGELVYLNWLAPMGDWEADVVLLDAAYAELTPATSDLINGRWSFAETQTRVYVTGKSYDRYAAAAALLDAWAAKVKLKVNFQAGPTRVNLSEQFAALRTLACEFRERQRPTIGRLTRSDLNADDF